MLQSIVLIPIVGALLLSLGFIGVLAEIFMRCYGLGAAISIIAFSLYFSGLLMSGDSEWIYVALFITGIILILIELHIPGFGIIGIIGAACTVISIVLSSPNIQYAMTSIIISILLTTIAAILIYRIAPKNSLFERLTLKFKLDKEEGFVGSDDYSHLLNKTGVSVTPLRPSGIAVIDGMRYDVVTQGEFIEKNTKIIVIDIEGRRIIVKENNI